MTQNPITRIPLLLAALAVLLLAPPTFADAEHNAALRYWRGMAMLTPDLEEAIKAVEFDALASPDWAPDDVTRELLASDGARSAIHEFIKGGKLPECDFGMDPEDGIEMLLPHLGGLRVSAKLLLMDGRILLEQGEAEAAATRFASAYSLASKSAGDGFIISSLVSASMLTQCNEVILHESVLNQLGAEGRQTVRLATWSFDDEDPFALLRSIEREGEIMESWLRRTFADPVSETQVRSFFETWTGSAENDEQIKSFLDIVNDAGRFEAELARLRLWNTDAAAALRSPEPVKELEKMTKAFKSTTSENPYGMFTEMFAPSMSRAKKNELKAVGELERARAMLAD